MPYDSAKANRIRSKRGLTIMQVAERLGVYWTRAAKLVANKPPGTQDPRLSTLENLCRVLDCQLAEVLSPSADAVPSVEIVQSRSSKTRPSVVRSTKKKIKK